MPRIRGTALVVRDGHFLLVKDRGAPSFSLPGGGQNRGKPALATAPELYEELGMSAAQATCWFAGDSSTDSLISSFPALSPLEQGVISSPWGVC